jgi:exonuclease III
VRIVTWNVDSLKVRLPREPSDHAPVVADLA